MLRAVYTLILGGVLLGVPLAADTTSQATIKPIPAANAHARVIQDFLKRVDAFVAVHRKLEDTLPRLPKQTTPQQIDVHERALSKLIQEARKNARQGDIFTLGMQRFIRTTFRPIFAGNDGLHIKSEILDNEYKGNVKLVVNGRYPDEIPISTMPPQVLAALPKLPEELEYRFLQNNLILFDPHAHIIADFMVRAFN